MLATSAEAMNNADSEQQTNTSYKIKCIMLSPISITRNEKRSNAKNIIKITPLKLALLTYS